MPPRQAAVVHTTVAHLRQELGQVVEHYAVVLELGGALFKSSTDGDDVALTDDGVTVIQASGGTQCAWIRCRENEQGDNLAAGSQTITVADGRWRVLPVSTLAGDVTWTLSVSGAVAGDWIEFTRLDVTGYTVAIVNGGVAAGTLMTLPTGQRSHARLAFNGVNWIHRDSGLLL